MQRWITRRSTMILTDDQATGFVAALPDILDAARDAAAHTNPGAA